MASKKGNTWEQQILNEVSQRRRKTYLGKNHPSLKPHEHPNHKVYEITTNRALDEEKRDLIAGPEWSIMLQSSLLKAGHDMLGRRLGFNLTFEQWFQDWSEGFRWGINRTGTAGMKTNYPLTTVTRGDDTIEGWRTEKERRPAYLEWKNPNKKLEKNYRVIEYWKDKSINQSIVLTGSDLQIIQQILQIEYEGGGTRSESEERPTKNFEVTYTGAPVVTLYFFENSEDVEKGYQRIKGEVRFRLIGKSVEPDSMLPLLTGAEVRTLALRIQQAFLTPEPFSYRRGKELVSIDDRHRGLVSWQYVYSKSEGRNLYSRIYQAMGLTLDNTKLNHSVNEDPANAFPTIPPTINILGESVKTARKRPVGTVHFTSAKLFLSQIERSVLLCDHKGYLFQSLEEGV